MSRFYHAMALAIFGLASVSTSAPALAEAKPVWTPPIKFDYKIIPVTGCVLRPTSDAATAEMSCTPNPITIAQCEETKGELGSIDGQLMCRTPRNRLGGPVTSLGHKFPGARTAPMGPGGKPPVAAASPYEPPYGPDAEAEGRWRPKIITIKTRPISASGAASVKETK